MSSQKRINLFEFTFLWFDKLRDHEKIVSLSDSVQYLAEFGIYCEKQAFLNILTRYAVKEHDFFNYHLTVKLCLESNKFNI